MTATAPPTAQAIARAIDGMRGILDDWLPSDDAGEAATKIAKTIMSRETWDEEDVHLAITDALHDPLGHRDWYHRARAMARVRGYWFDAIGRTGVGMVTGQIRARIEARCDVRVVEMHPGTGTRHAFMLVPLDPFEPRNGASPSQPMSGHVGQGHRRVLVVEITSSSAMGPTGKAAVFNRGPVSWETVGAKLGYREPDARALSRLLSEVLAEV